MNSAIACKCTHMFERTCDYQYHRECSIVTAQKEQILDPVQREKIASKVSAVGVAGNFVLTLFKLFAGIVANSGAMVSDAIHSASDVLSTIIVWVSMKFATKSADEDHPYGHERFECVAALILAFILAIAGGGIAISGFKKIIGLEPVEVPGMLALIAAGVSIVTKEIMYQYTIKAARKINSSALTANAWDHRSDAFSSMGSFAGILGAILGFPKLDAVASIVIAGFLLRVTYTIFMDAVNKMVDHACDKEFVEELESAILAQSDEIKGIDNLKTRLFGDRVYVDVEISVDGSKTLEDAHVVAKGLHDHIEAEFPTVKHCMVHVNPAADVVAV